MDKIASLNKIQNDGPKAALTSMACATDCCGSAPSPVVAPKVPAVAGATRYRIATMDCSAEESEIRRALDPIAGITNLRFDLGQRVLTIAAAPDVLPAAVEAIKRVGFDPQPTTESFAAGPSRSAHAHGHESGNEHEHKHSTFGAGIGRLVLALALAIGAEALSFFAPDTAAFKGVGMVLALAAIALAGLDTYKKGLGALRHGRLNINALMAVAVSGAFVIGQWPEAAMVMALYAIAELIEARSVDRARNAIQSLLALAPEQAEVKQGDGTWKQVMANDVALEAIVRIRPGERVPLDGVVTAGSSAINQAPVTGESIPVDKIVGDPVFAGTINETAALEFRVTAAASNSTLARIIHAVEEAQGTRAPTQRFVDRFAAVYTPAVFVLALAVAVLTPWAMAWTWLEAVYKALVLLVIACPCALIISTPVTVVSALASAARRGILIKGGTYLEEARNLKAIALDKTGTVTEGKPKLVEFVLVDPTANKDQIAALAVSLSGRSDHPVSKAISAGLTGEALEVEEFQVLVGRGVQGRISGQVLVLGNHRLVEERKQCSPELEVQLRTHEEAGRTVTLLAGEAGVLALFAVADTIKESSRRAVAELKALGVTPVMLTGDNEATAKTIAKEAGIDEAQGNLLPEDKLAAIKGLQARHGATAMTGDGINDAPALAQADIGFAMGGAGTHTAMEAADVVIMNDDLSRIPETIRLSRRTHAVLWQNISLALGVKAVFLLLAVFGHASMWMAVFADTGASLLVVANGLRLLRS
jgi:Cd2+/Zn2+-exporting ATPase